jgi:uncharacterized protein YhbP (UPF0306 family)
MSKEKLFEFLESQRLLIVASSDGEVWISNVYYGIDEDFKIYFVGSEETRRSKQVLANSEVAFSVVWFNEGDHKDRKGIQGTGVCRKAENDEEISKGVELHNKYYPEFADRVTVDWVKSVDNKSHVWVLEPKYMKFWNDGLYGIDGTEEFRFD